MLRLLKKRFSCLCFDYSENVISLQLTFVNIASPSEWVMKPFKVLSNSSIRPTINWPYRGEWNGLHVILR